MDFYTVATQCVPWIHPTTLAAIVKSESNFHSLSININWDADGKKGARLVHQPKTEQEAIITAKDLISKGYNIDVGPGAINSSNLKSYQLTIEDAFKPCKNLAVAGSILYWNYQKALPLYHGDVQAATLAAVSMYNTGSFTRGFQNGYVRMIQSNVTQMPAINFNFKD